MKKQRLEIDYGTDELVIENNEVKLKLTVFMDHVNADGEEGGGIEIPLSVPLHKQLKNSFGIAPEFSPYQEEELRSTLLALKKLVAIGQELIGETETELNRMEEDPEYFDEDDEDEDL